MRESTTYQDILREGREEGRAQGEAQGEAQGRKQEVRALILRLGRKRFGEPLQTIVAALDTLGDLAHLEALAERLLDVESWDELISEN